MTNFNISETKVSYFMYLYSVCMCYVGLNSFVRLFLFVIKNIISALWAVKIIIKLLHVAGKKCHHSVSQSMCSSRYM